MGGKQKLKMAQESETTQVEGVGAQAAIIGGRNCSYYFWGGGTSVGGWNFGWDSEGSETQDSPFISFYSASHNNDHDIYI